MIWGVKVDTINVIDLMITTFTIMWLYADDHDNVVVDDDNGNDEYDDEMNDDIDNDDEDDGNDDEVDNDVIIW